MMGNFLTTLGNTPEQDRAMFEDLGLDISRQPDNGSNPRPDNRSGGWRATRPRSRTRRAHRQPIGRQLLGSLDAAQGDQEEGEGPGLPRTRGLGRLTVPDISEHLEGLRESGLHRRLRMVESPQGPQVLLDGKAVMLLCSNDYLGLADDSQVRCAASDAAMHWGAGAGTSAWSQAR